MKYAVRLGGYVEGKDMKTLVVFYSRTGCTRRVAEDLARRLGADQEELKEQADRSGAAGYIAGGRDAMLKHPADLLPVIRKPEDYDMIVVATPVWAFTLCPAIRTWLQREASHVRRVAFVCTQGGRGAGRAIQHMREIAGRDPVATLVLLERDVRAGACEDALATFASEIARIGA